MRVSMLLNKRDKIEDQGSTIILKETDMLES